MSNYATKSELKNVRRIDTSNFALKSHLAGLKTEFYKLGIDKLIPVPVDLNKLSDLVRHSIVKKICSINSLLK